MKKISIRLVIFFTTISAGLAQVNPAGPAEAVAPQSDTSVRRMIDQAVAAVKPAVVRIHVVSVEHFQGREEKQESSGSGVIITPEGHVVTNHHVAGKARRIVCTLYNKEERDAELVGTDPLTDISVVKLLPRKRETFSFARFGDSSRLEVGDYVLAVGSPLALSQSVTMGIVSNTALTMPDLFWPFEQFTLEGEDVGSIVRWIGHDAPIYGGNSGGPLVNLKGEIVGINEVKIGLSGAIPGNLARQISEEIIRTGKVSRSWIGLEVQPLLKSGGTETGVLVSGTLNGSPAEKAGFHPGDIIVELGGRPVSTRFAEELPLFNQLIMGIPVGDTVKATVLRNGKKITLKVKTEEREYARPQTFELKQWGITARNLSLIDIKEMRRDSKDGVLVTSVRPGGPGGDAELPLFVKDVILKVNDTPVTRVETLMELTSRLSDGKEEPVPVLVTFDRNKERNLTVVKVGIEKMEDPGLEVRKAWLPVAMQAITRDMVRQMDMEGLTGVRVTQVYPDTVAEKAGLKVGDLIVELDGEPIPVSEPQDVEILPASIRQYRIGSTVQLTVIRGEKKLTLPVTLPMSPFLPREMKKYRNDDFEFTVRDLAFLDRVNEGWKEDRKGVLVETVGEGGWAALAHLAVGDLIVTVDGTPVTEVKSFQSRIESILEKKPGSVVFQILRGIHSLYIEIEPSWPEIR